MSEEDKNIQKHLVDEMMKVFETNPDVILYMQSLMENYQKLEQENKQLKEENAGLKEWKEDLLNENIALENIRKEAIEFIKDHYNLATKEEGVAFFILRDRLLEILGDKENE